MTERRGSLATSIKSELTANAKIWLTAFAAMIAYTPCAGTLTSFPVSANYLKTQMGASQETINTISSLAFGFTVGLCPLSSILFKKIGYRNVGILGVFGVGISMGLSMFATEIWQVYLTYSFMFGFFNNCAYNGLISFVGDQFLGTSYVASATALFGCGISLGTMIFSSAGTSIMLADITNGWRNRSLLHSVSAIIAGCIFVILTNHAKKLNGSIGDEPEEHVTNKLVQAGASVSFEAKVITNRAIKAGVNEFENIDLPPSEKSDSKYNCKVSLSKQTISRTNLTGAVNQVSNKSVSELLPECFSTNSMYLFAFWLWLVGTFVWSSTYTIPYSTANSWPEFQCEIAQNQTDSRDAAIVQDDGQYQNSRDSNCQDGMRTVFLGQMMTILGLCELISRVMQVLGGALIPERGFASAYAIFSFVAAVAMGVLINNESDAMIYVFFVLFPIMTGFLNGFMFGATTDIFTMVRFQDVWSVLNVALALGFALGPVISAYVFKTFYRELCSLCLVVAGVLFLGINFTFKKEHRNELRTGNGETDSLVKVELQVI